MDGLLPPLRALRHGLVSTATEGIGKSKLVLLGGGLAVAVLFFVFTALVGKSPKKQAAGGAALSSEAGGHEAIQGKRDPCHGDRSHSRTGQFKRALGPGDIRRTRSSDGVGVRTRTRVPRGPQRPSRRRRILLGTFLHSPTRSKSGKSRSRTASFSRIDVASAQQQNGLEGGITHLRAQPGTEPASSY